MTEPPWFEPIHRTGFAPRSSRNTRRMLVDLWGDLSKHLLYDAATIKK